MIEGRLTAEKGVKMFENMLKEREIKRVVKRMKKRVVDYDNFDLHLQDIEKLLNIGDLSAFDLTYSINVIRDNPDIPSDMKAAIIVTIRKYLPKSRNYKLWKLLQKGLDNCL